MKAKRRSKSSRYPGTKTHGRGRKNRTRGLGNRGGRGLSGTGKRGDQKKTMIIGLYGNNYFGKVRRGQGTKEKRKTPSISIRTIGESIHGLVRKGKAKEAKGGYEIRLENYKIIGKETLHTKVTIYAKEATEGAIESVKKAGGEIILSNAN